MRYTVHKLDIDGSGYQDYYYGDRAGHNPTYFDSDGCGAGDYRDNVGSEGTRMGNGFGDGNEGDNKSGDGVGSGYSILSDF